MIKFTRNENETLEFNTVDEMKNFIVKDWYGLIKPETITVSENSFKYVYGQIDKSSKKTVVGLIMEEHK